MTVLGDIAGAGTPSGDPASDIEIKGVTANSKEVEPGFVFAALPGVKMDGARFISSAIENGAVAILTHAGADVSGLSVPVIVSKHPRRDYALMVGRFYHRQPQTVVAITGTNGKTSVAAFVRQVWAQLGIEAASLGTVGVVTGEKHYPLQHTTPEPVALHRLLARIADEGVTHLALEASSHGLAQHRLDGVRISAAAFTNLSRDHLDYHKDFEDYLNAKLRLFRDLLPAGSPVVVDPDTPGGEAVIKTAKACGHRLFTVGAKGEDLQLLGDEIDGYSQKLTLKAGGESFHVRLPLVGDFQVANALTTAGLCIAMGAPADRALKALETLQGASGRLELVGVSGAGAPVFVDYAHTPDALEKALLALRPYVKNRLHVVFGCGGDRDRGKRPLMGEAAVKNAEHVIVADDNPRSEDPALIRAQIMQAAPGATEIGDRAKAINAAVGALQKGDVLLVAGKGHETGQIVGDKVLPFSDQQEVARALEQEAETHG